MITSHIWNMFYVHGKCKIWFLSFPRLCNNTLKVGLLEIYCSLQHWKNFTNPSRIGKLIAMVRVPRTSSELCRSYIVVVPDGIDDGRVALQCHDQHVVGWGDQKVPEREPREPHATNELIVDAVAWHTSTVHLDNGRQQREEGRTEVQNTLIDDQNVHRLKKTKSGHSCRRKRRIAVAHGWLKRTRQVATMCTPSNRPTCFLGPTWVHNPNDISIGSAVFAGLTIVTDRRTTLQQK